MSKLAVALLLLGLLGACADIHGVSSATGTNIQGAPGTAADAATGGQGNRGGAGRP